MEEEGGIYNNSSRRHNDERSSPGRAEARRQRAGFELAVLPSVQHLTPKESEEREREREGRRVPGMQPRTTAKFMERRREGEGGLYVSLMEEAESVCAYEVQMSPKRAGKVWKSPDCWLRRWFCRRLFCLFFS